MSEMVLMRGSREVLFQEDYCCANCGAVESCGEASPLWWKCPREETKEVS